MTFPETNFGKATSLTVVAALLLSAVPIAAIADSAAPPPAAPTGKIIKSAVAGTKAVQSRALSARELNTRIGRYTVNPYLAGTSKWDTVVNGVNVHSGNYTTGATDLSFEGGYGDPVNVTRTYNSNQVDEGPLGKGWTLSCDIRTTAGGVLKGPASPNRSVPLSFRDRPEQFGGVPNDPVEGVIATDASGYEETIQRDVDGILTTPGWDKNLTYSTHQLEEFGGNLYWVTTGVTTVTPEGAKMQYEVKGEYTYGWHAYGDSSHDQGKPAKILKITQVEDRHGNLTTYGYDSGLPASFSKQNGVTSEKKLVSITMPNGKAIEFTWGEDDTPLASRIISATDGTRTVTYGYSSSGGLLTSVTSPAGFTTTYGYGGLGQSKTSTGTLLRSITDPRGQETDIWYYDCSHSNFAPYGTYEMPSVVAFHVKQPNDVHTYVIAIGETGFNYDDPPTDPVDHPLGGEFYQTTGAVTSVGSKLINRGQSTLTKNEQNPYVEATIVDPWATTDTQGGPQQGFATVSYSKFNARTQDLTQHIQRTYPRMVIADGDDVEGTLRADRSFVPPSYAVQSTTTDTTYNYRGKPLSVKTTERTGETATSEKKTQYAYWDADKYYQQKAVRVKVDVSGGNDVWRYSFTDYYTAADGAGKDGQVKKVYDPKYGIFSNTSGDSWRDNITVNGDSYSASFVYDDFGRATNVYKIRSGTPGSTGTYTYVRTFTEYDDTTSSPGYFYGAAKKVTEDYGGSNHRSTETNAYDSAGRATKVSDAAGRVFETTYDADGRVQEVNRTDGDDQQIVYYEYGTEGISNGMPVYIYDGQSDIEQWIEYQAWDSDEDANNGGFGQPSVVEERSDVATHSWVSYTYNRAGDRETVTYQTPSTGFQSTPGIRWKYSDYLRVGSPDSPKRVFRTMTKMAYVSSAWATTSEEFHYAYDAAGRLQYAAFGQVPETGQTSYSGAHPAAYRVLSQYNYDPAGRMLSLKTGAQKWDTGLNPDAYRSVYQNLSNATNTDDVTVAQTDCVYEPYLGLKTSSRQKMWGSTGTLTSDKTQSYGYDSALDYLTSTTYTITVGSGSTTPDYWYYDAAGNRYTNSGLSDHTYDNLNRMTASPGYSYDNHPGASSDGDVLLGNRRWRNYGTSGAVRYKWDSTNRLLQTASANSGGEYKYRADGMRVKKVTGFLINWVPPSGEVSGYYDDEQDANFPTYRYFYDGQMCFEDDYTEAQPGEPPTTAYSGNRYGLGARGIDYIETFAQSGSAIIETGRGLPVYDAHGNMVSTVGRTIVSGALTAYSVSNSREFGPWGDVRTGSGTGFPTQRYCASIGHVQDDESGLIYMRARYYEPGTGRFISEDPAQNGKNWTVYCGNNPIGRIDYSGRSFFQIAEIFEAIMQLFNIRDNIRVGLYGISNPGEFQVGKALGAMALNLLIDTIMGVGVTAIAEAMVASFTLGPLGIAAGLVCIFMIAAIMIVCYLAEEQINEKLVYGG